MARVGPDSAPSAAELITNRYGRPRPLTQAIEDLIVEGGFQPGDLLPSEAALGAQLGVSRTALREAMRTLNALDIVSIRHGHGTYVGYGSLSPMVSSLVFRGSLHGKSGVQGLHDILEVRIAIDKSNAPELCARLNGTSNGVLTSLVDRMLAKAAIDEDIADEDRTFHLELQSHVGNDLMTQLVGAFWDVHSLLKPRLGSPRADASLVAAQAHADMLHAAQSGDVDAYLEALERHYGPIRDDIARADEPAQTAASAHDLLATS